MPNHMPAPWSYDATQRGPVQIKSRHGFQVGTALTVDDARLMASAPDLLAALSAQRCFDCGQWIEASEGRRSPCVACAPAVAAIARAEGRTDGR